MLFEAGTAFTSELVNLSVETRGFDEKQPSSSVSGGAQLLLGEGLRPRSWGSCWRCSGIAALSVLIIGCQLKTQEPAHHEPPLKLVGPDQTCFSESLKTIERYFKSAAVGSDIDAAFTCISSALDTFSIYGRGAKKADSFSPTELRAFLEQYFLNDLKISDGMLAEVMRVKQALLGGGNDRLTKKEIAKLIDVLGVIRVEAQRLRPYIGILTQNTPATQGAIDSSFLEQALSDFSYSTDKLGALLGQSMEVYRLEDFKRLLGELQELYRGRSTWRGPDWFSKRMPLFAAAKSILIKPNGDAIAPDEWRSLFINVGRIYSLFLRFHYTLENRDFFSGEGLAQLEIGINEGFDIAETALKAKGPAAQQVVSYKMLEDLVDGLAAAGSDSAMTLPLGIRSETVKRLLSPVLEKLLGTAPRSYQGGLTAGGFARLKDIILGWIEMHQLWERVEVEAGQDPALKGKAIPIAKVRQIWKGFSPVHKEPWSDLKSLFDRHYALSTRANGSLVFESAKTLTMDRASFVELHWKQTLVRIIGHGYLADPVGMRMQGVTLGEFKTIFDDFRDLAIDLRYLDPKDDTIWKTAFTISNVFLFSSDGDEYLGYHEATDLFVFTFAASKISQAIRDDVQSHCVKLAPDPIGYPMIQAPCWRERVQLGYQSFFADIPGWRAAVRGKDWTSTSWKQFFDDIERSIRKAHNPKGPLTSPEMDRSVSIHHYIEATFTRWDSDRNGKLDFDEAENAFPLFDRVLRTASGFTDEDEVLALYYYLLTYGEAPNEKRVSDVLFWLGWKNDGDVVWRRKVNADRAKVMKIFGSLADKL